MIENEIRTVCDSLKEKFSPEKIIIYNKRTNLSGKVTSFKVCLVIDAEDVLQCESKIYSTVESEIPFDVLIYTPSQWDEFSKKDDCFAQKIDRTGVIVL